MNDELFQKLKELERYCKEDFLVSLTNKGIYNRALKDFEKIKDVKGNIIARWGGTCGRWDIS